MEKLLRDIRYALRSLARTPGFTLGIVLTLALGIGANATMFGVVDTLFLRAPSLVRDADQVRRIYISRGDALHAYTGATTTIPTFNDLHDSGIFENVAAISHAQLSLGRGVDAKPVTAELVSHEFFPLLGVSPAIGHFFTADDDREGAPPTVVLADGFWKRQFGGDRSILGRPLLLGKATYTVIAVAPPTFTGIDLGGPDAWLPIHGSASDAIPGEALHSRNWQWNQVIARVKPGARDQDVAALATTAYRRGALSVRGAQHWDSSAVVVLGPIQAARGPEAGAESKVSAWVGVVAVIVLLIACANVANLLLARGVTRRREMALRAGLGAGRFGLVRMLLAESLVLAALGGAAAMLIAAWGGTLARGFLIPDLPADTALVDSRVLLFSLVAVALTALLTGLVPAIQTSRTDVAEALKSGTQRATGSSRRTRAALLVTQVALTLVLLVGAGLFVRSLRNVEHLDLGFDADKVLEAVVNLDATGQTQLEQNQTYLRLLDRVQHIPGVERAAAMQARFGWSFASQVNAEGVDSIPDTKAGGPYFNAVTPDYLQAMGTRVLEGRGLEASDNLGAPRVTVINRTMAKLIWPTGKALGKCLYLGDPKNKECTRIVGIVADAARQGITNDAAALYYVPAAQGPDSTSGAPLHGLVIRSRTHAADIAGQVRREMQAAGNLPFADVHSLAERIAPEYRSWRLGAASFSAFGALALVIAGMGIFAVISYSVSQRTQEIGIRMALGAEAEQVARMILGQGLRVAVIGLAIGGAGAYAMARGLASLLYGVPPGDPLVFAGVGTVLVSVAAMAAWLPARRAAKVDPMVALRYE